MKTTTRNPNISLSILLCAVTLHALTLAAFAQTTNQVLWLDGSNGYVSVPNSPDLQNAGEMTVEMWIYPEQPTDPNHGWFIVKGDGGSVDSQQSYQLNWDVTRGVTGTGVGADFCFFLNTSTLAVVGAPLASSNWVHVAASFSSASGLVQLFTNGILASATTNDYTGTIPLLGQTIRQTTLPVNIGGQVGVPGSTYGVLGHGFLDEVRIWNTARSAQDIYASMFCRLTGTETNLAGYWNFDDGTANDLTGHGHNGTFMGNAQAVPIVANDAVHAGLCGTVVSIRVSQVELCWDTRANYWYQLQLESALTTNQWVPFMTNWIAGDGNRFCTNDAVLANQVQRLYRVAVTNSPP